MMSMTVINAHAVAAREAARTSIGRFGQQEHTAPELNLDPYPYPRLKRGLRPDQVELNVWYREDENGELAWHVAAYPKTQTADGFDSTDHADGLFDSFTLPISDQTAAGIDEDHWTDLDAAPGWLRDAVLPSLVETTLNDFQTAEWRRARHEQIVAEGGFASTYDNEYIVEFEDEYPTNRPEDAAEALFYLPNNEEDGTSPEREAAAAELSRRAAAGVGGLLIDARQLRPGDQVSVAHLTTHFDQAWARERYATVTVADAGGTDGDLHLRLDDGATLHLPTGARLPAVGYRVGDEELTGTDLVAQLVREGATSYRASKELTPAQVVARYNIERGLEPGDPEYIDTITPTLEGAQL